MDATVSPHPRLSHNMASSMAQCVASLKGRGMPTFPPFEDALNGALWCNATWDSVLCWPAIPANSSVSLPCPPLKGLDPTIFVVKQCHALGRWAGKPPSNFSSPAGWTDYNPCFLIDPSVIECHPTGHWMSHVAGVADVNARGWTNFTMCMTEEVLLMLSRLNNESMQKAQEIARGARKLEFVGLGLSFISLCLCVFIFSYFRRLRVFRNMLHLQLFIAILMVVVIRLTLYIDLIFTDRMGSMQSLGGRTINTMAVVCESMYFLLEYFKTSAFAWMFIEGFYLHNTLVCNVFSDEPKFWRYIIAGYGLPLIHTSFWFLVVLFKAKGDIERCLGSYYLQPEFWILDLPRMLELVINLIFICNVIRVLWTKVRATHNSTELERMTKSVKAALMLIPLLGIPNIMQTIPFTPTEANITYFAIWTYCASFSYMFQGFMIAILYCFTNKEVINVLKTTWGRYRLQHTTSEGLRRGSRAVTGTLKNGASTPTPNLLSTAATAQTAFRSEQYYAPPTETQPLNPKPPVVHFASLTRDTTL